jgi:hypothetical protein
LFASVRSSTKRICIGMTVSRPMFYGVLKLFYKCKPTSLLCNWFWGSSQPLK